MEQSNRFLYQSSFLRSPSRLHATAKRFSQLSLLPFVLIFAAWPAAHTYAGLVASEVVVVVNGNSLDSRALANHYISLRNIPAANVVVLDKVPNAEVISVEKFRELILVPLLTELDRRKISNHIQCIAYSADFPTAIDIQTDIKPLGKLPIFYTSRGSLNGLTFLYQFVQASNPAYIQLDANHYARREIDLCFVNPLGTLTEPQWKAAESLIAESKHQEAAEVLAQLATKYPDHFPLAYLAAAQFAAANQIDRSIEWLEKAIASGWSAGGYLKADARFEKLRDESRFQLLLLSLDETERKYQPTVGFEAKRAWGADGVSSPDLKLGARYLLSTVLGVTRGAGTTVPQAIEMLDRSAQADFTQPTGSFYFSLTKDVRTTTRWPGFDDATQSLKDLGFGAEVITDALPMRKTDVLGAMIGTPNFDWSTSNSTLLPGSIAENLTSVGAVMNSLGGQTKLTELIKAGAAGSSGTVTEPYSMQAKFPSPQLYVHYARGLSLAEAFYASVTGPYQLLIIGDPLCQPFATPPQLQVDQSLRRLAANATLSFPLTYRSEPPAEGKRPPQNATLLSALFDDTPAQSGPVRKKADIKLTGAPDGYHELRVISIGEDALNQKSEVVLPIWLGSEDAITLTAPATIAFSNRKVTVKATAKAAQSLSLWHESEQLAVEPGASAEFSVPLDSLGTGKVRLQARAELESGKVLKSIPLVLEITP